MVHPYPYTPLRLLIIAALLSSSLSQPSNFNIKHEQQDSALSSSPKLLPYHVLPVYGNASLGYFYVNLYVGSPVSQPQTVIVDTGSGILAVPCSYCKQCGNNHINPPYNPSNSTASKQLVCVLICVTQGDKHPSCQSSCSGRSASDNCTFSIHYAEGSSLSGLIMEDDIRFETFAENEQIRASIGCTERQTNLFVTQKANGIFGLAPKRDSNLLEELIKKHSSQSGERLEFSLCLAPNGGVMTVGATNHALHQGKRQPDLSIGFQSDKNLYTLVGVQEISIDDTFIFTSLTDRFQGYGIFIDSGSTFSYLPRQKYRILEEKLNMTCINSKRCKVGRGEDSTCYQLDLNEGENLAEEVDKMFPPLRYKMLNKNINWAATSYMLVREEKRHEVCLGILELDRYLLGANWMYNRDIQFDLSTRMVHIYDNISCEKNANIMGRYLDNVETQGAPQIVFSNSTSLFGVSVNTGQPMFLMGVVFLILALLGFALMIAGACDSRNTPQLIQQEEEDEANMASHQAEGDRIMGQNPQAQGGETSDVRVGSSSEMREI